jgi:hypothetical protein
VPAPSPSAVATPTLPAAALPTTDARSDRYNFTYTLKADLASLPKSAYAYVVTWRTYTAADVAALAQSLGLHRAVEQTADGYRATGNGTLTVSNTGLIHYTAPGVAEDELLGAVGTPTATPAPTGPPHATATPTAAPTSPPQPTATPSAGQPTVELTGSDDHPRQGQEFTVRVEASDSDGIDIVYWWATSTDDEGLRETHTRECDGATPCRRTWTASTNDTGTIVLHSQARDTKGNLSPETTLEIVVGEATPTPTGTAATATPTAGTPVATATPTATTAAATATPTATTASATATPTPTSTTTP